MGVKCESVCNIVANNWGANQEVSCSNFTSAINSQGGFDMPLVVCLKPPIYTMEIIILTSLQGCCKDDKLRNMKKHFNSRKYCINANSYYPVKVKQNIKQIPFFFRIIVFTLPSSLDNDLFPVICKIPLSGFSFCRKEMIAWEDRTFKALQSNCITLKEKGKYTPLTPGSLQETKYIQ